MTIPLNQDGKIPIEERFRNLIDTNDVMSSRKGGGILKASMKGRKILVDSREFRSALPAILHQNEFSIRPFTLDVGDYILSPDIVIERKSLNDLQSSLNSGRLYNQAKKLCRYFKKPMLLIEFHQDKPFLLQEEYTADVQPNSIISKIVLLTIHFPSLRLLWSRSPYATASLFASLKRNQKDPDENLVGNVISADEEAQDSPEVRFLCVKFSPSTILSKLLLMTSHFYSRISCNLFPE